MEISRQSAGDLVILRLRGRLDANWCPTVEAALSASVRRGEHRLHLDMAEVSYLSSAGLRVLLASYKQLHAIQGRFGVVQPSDAVRSVLELSGLQRLIASEEPVSAPTASPVQEHESAHARFQLFPLGPGLMRGGMVGDPAMLQRGVAAPGVETRKFGAHSVAIGIGALGSRYEESAVRCGEFLAVAGVAAFQPGDGSSRPDFVLSEGAWVPEGHLVLGLWGEGAFAKLARFEVRPEARSIGLSELTEQALAFSESSAAMIVVLAETAGLVGATLRQSPAPPATSTDARFGFPQIRDWLSFTSERAFRDSTTLIVGVIARPGSPFESLLRPMAPGSNLRGHVHAAVFPYRPLREGQIELTASVNELFEGPSLQAVLHLLCDPRAVHGAGESEFFRGAIWIAPFSPHA